MRAPARRHRAQIRIGERAALPQLVELVGGAPAAPASGCGKLRRPRRRGRSKRVSSSPVYSPASRIRFQTSLRSRSTGYCSTNAATAGTGPGAYADDVAQALESPNQVTAVPPCPASITVLRGFIDSVTTRDAGEAARSRSPSVGTRRLAALWPTVRPLPPYAQAHDAAVVGARHAAVLGAVPPLVHDDAVRGGEAAGGDRGVPGTRDGVQVRIEGLFEYRAFVAQPLQAALQNLA